MFERRPSLNRGDLILIVSALALGLMTAAAFGAYQAVSADGEGAGGRMSEFAASLLWPGALIFAGVAAVVLVGWKANLD